MPRGRRKRIGRPSGRLSTSRLEFELEQSERGLAVPYDAERVMRSASSYPGTAVLSVRLELRHRLGDNAGIGHPDGLRFGDTACDTKRKRRARASDRLFVTTIFSCVSYLTVKRHRPMAFGVVPQSAKRRTDTQHAGATMMRATQYAGRATLLALATTCPSFAQSRTAMENGYPSQYCLPTTVDSSDEQKVYCEGWRAFRKGW